MPVPVTYPGVYIEEIPSGVRPITGVATSIAAFIGWAVVLPLYLHPTWKLVPLWPNEILQRHCRNGLPSS